jgi:hypothetical protein
VNTNNDESNCGACFRRCTTGFTCQSGSCNCTNTMCGTACVALDTDESNCGSCGHACAAGQTCVGGVCS